MPVTFENRIVALGEPGITYSASAEIYPCCEAPVDLLIFSSAAEYTSMQRYGEKSTCT